MVVVVVVVVVVVEVVVFVLLAGAWSAQPVSVTATSATKMV